VANNLLTDQHITQEALMILENNLTFTKHVDRQLDQEFKNAKRGATISVRKPPRYVLRDGQNIAIQDTTQTQVPFTLSHQFGVDVEFFSSDLALSISDFGEEILKPQIATISNGIDWAGMQLASKVANAIGTPGTTPGFGLTTNLAQNTLALYTQAGAVLDKTATPRDSERNAVINEDAQSVLVSNLSGLFQDSTDVGRQYREGTMGRTIGNKFSMDQNTSVITIGAFSGTATVNGAGQGMLTPPGQQLGTAGYTPFVLNVNGFTPGATVAGPGDRFTLPGMFMTNPQNHMWGSKLQTFVVLNATPVVASGTGTAALMIEPPIIASGPYQTVSKQPANGDALAWIGVPGTQAVQNLIFHKTAFTFASVNLPLPQGMHMAARKSDKKLGISLRFVAGYQIATDQFIGRFDVLCGWLCQRPECAVVLYG
jgi:hypothetical protein